jgi:hypothetical protein
LVEAHESKPLAALLAPPLRKLLFELDRMAGAGDKAKRGLAILRSFLGAVKATIGDVEVGLDIEPMQGIADSGDLEADLPDLFAAVAEAAQERKMGVAILIDEIQYFGAPELSALIMAMHRMQQRQLPLVLIGAGLPTLPGLAGESKSYSERLFSFPIVGPLPQVEAERAVSDPIRAEEAAIDEPALHEIYRLTNGYPYFLQEWAYQAWNHAPRSPISLTDVQSASQTVIARLDQNFFRVRYDRLTPAEKKFLRSMAEIGLGSHRTGDVAAIYGAKVTNVSLVRSNLIKKGMVYSPSYGEIAFTVPLFDEFMRRAIPTFDRDAVID